MKNIYLKKWSLVFFDFLKKYFLLYLYFDFLKTTSRVSSWLFFVVLIFTERYLFCVIFRASKTTSLSLFSLKTILSIKIFLSKDLRNTRLELSVHCTSPVVRVLHYAPSRSPPSPPPCCCHPSPLFFRCYFS